MNEFLSPNDLLTEGKKLYQAKKYNDAASSFLRAEEGFKTQNNLPDAAEAANNRSVCLLQAGNAESALAAVMGTADIFEQAGDTLRQGMAWGNQAFALEELNRNAEALQAYQKSNELLKEVGENELRSTVLGRISGLQIKMGKQVEAITSMDAALNQKEHLSIKERFLKNLIEKANNLIKGK